MPELVQCRDMTAARGDLKGKCSLASASAGDRGIDCIIPLPPPFPSLPAAIKNILLSDRLFMRLIIRYRISVFN